jgi:hypothetical protein
VRWLSGIAMFQQLRTAMGRMLETPRRTREKPKLESTSMAVMHFRDDDDAYLRWVERHSNGFVVNCYRTPSPSYLMLHRATCRSINTPARTNYTTKVYMKVCALGRQDLERWASVEIGGHLTDCGMCRP